MRRQYTDEANVAILVALMKRHGIRRVIVSPGTTNITFVASIQGDGWFRVWSAADERQAAYMACGMAAETGEPVTLSCTGATASRNYLPGLTEAYYRKLPVLAITSSQHLGRVGNMVPQVTDRSCPPPDTCRLSVQLPPVASGDDRWACEATANRAILELMRDGGGPVHINLVTSYSSRFVGELPVVRTVDRIGLNDELPSLDGGRVAVYVGAHRPMGQRLTRAIDAFCARFDAVVLCDHTSNYHGNYRVFPSLMLSQDHHWPDSAHVDVLIHIGEVSGAYVQPRLGESWRVSPDGEPKDAFGALRYVFDMSEASFFEAYAMGHDGPARHTQLDEWRADDALVRAKMPELPFSNIWCASRLAPMLPEGCSLHLGILNSLRSWNFFDVDPSVQAWSNTGGFGIDGGLSTMLGASLASPERLFFGVFGDLATFYDMNSLGNRHVGNNLRIMVVNNGVGTEFKNYNHKAAAFGDEADPYIAARGHYGNQSAELLRHYAQDLGFEYLHASDMGGFLKAASRFTTPERLERPVLFEVFTDSVDESAALHAMRNIQSDTKSVAKEAVKEVLGDRGVRAVKRILGR